MYGWHLFRVSAVRASFANGRRASRASYAAGSRRMSQLTRSRASMVNANANASSEAGGGGGLTAVGDDGDDEASAATKSSTGGPGSRRESAMLLVRMSEDGGGPEGLADGGRTAVFFYVDAA